MWNMVKIDDIYYEFDLTWDDNGDKDFGYNYFGLSLTDVEKDHVTGSQTYGISYLSKYLVFLRPTATIS